MHFYNSDKAIFLQRYMHALKAKDLRRGVCFSIVVEERM